MICASRPNRSGRTPRTGSFRAELLHSFDLARGPLIRTHLVRLAAKEHLLLIAMHQIMVDGRSLGVFRTSCRRCTKVRRRKRPPTLPPLRDPIRAISPLGSDNGGHIRDVTSQLDYWREQLRDPLPADDIRRPAGRRAVATPPNRASETVHCRRALTQAVKEFGHREGATLFMALVAALLSCCTVPGRR